MTWRRSVSVAGREGDRGKQIVDHNDTFVLTTRGRDACPSLSDVSNVTATYPERSLLEKKRGEEKRT
jgi:hypothetical protein